MNWPEGEPIESVSIGRTVACGLSTSGDQDVGATWAPMDSNRIAFDRLAFQPQDISRPDWTSTTGPKKVSAGN